jgi:hypothetical protein
MWPYIIFPVLYNRKPYFLRIGNYSKYQVTFFSLKLLNIEQINLIVDYN